MFKKWDNKKAVGKFNWSRWIKNKMLCGTKKTKKQQKK